MINSAIQINQIIPVVILSPFWFGLILCAIPFIIIAYKRWLYKQSEYYDITKKSYHEMRYDYGFYGEYLIYEHLAPMTGNRKFLFNCYIPKKDGTTTEIDVILIHTSGIYVFESKNVSGWIFGTETQKTWTRTFRNGRKESFSNPLMQNSTHIKWLKRLLPEISDDAFHSIIVFSDRCELIKINLTTMKHYVLKRRNVFQVVSAIANNHMLSDAMVDDIYQKLYPYSQVSDEVRASHINAINNRMHNDNIKAITLSPNLTEAANSTSHNHTHFENGVYKPVMYCSKCGSEMVIKTASKGLRTGKSFWGCSSFPRCRNTINID